MKKKASFLIALGASTLFAAMIISFPHLSLVGANEVATYYCADLDFGRTRYSGSESINNYTDTINGTASSNSYKTYAHNIMLSYIGGDHVYFGEASSSTDYALRVGSSGSTGTVTFNFREALSLEYVEVYAWCYDGSSVYNLYASSNVSSEVSTIECEGTSAMDFSVGSGVRPTSLMGLNNVTSITFSNDKGNRVCLGKILFKITEGGSGPSSSSSSSSSSQSSSSSSSSNSTSSSWSSNSGSVPTISYYDSINWNLTGAALKTDLADLINSHTSIGYDNLWEAYRTTDVDENGKLVDMYSDRRWTPGSQQCGNYSKEGDCVNREHTVPQSVLSTGVQKCDIFHVYPTDGYVNGRRSNNPHGEVSSATWTSSNGSMVGNCSYPGYSGRVFEPIDRWKGDIARSYFYMVTCYQSGLMSWDNFALFTKNTYPSFSSWGISMLLEWHDADPVDEWEAQRNERCYSVQHNRNPFIDYPEAAHLIWDNAY